MFRYESPFLVNEKGKVMDVHGGVDQENRQMIVWNKHGKLNQQFDLIYADEYPDEPTKGELNERFGLYVERPFYVVSQLASNRYLDLINNRNMVIKTPNGRNTQQWWFDQKSLTIRTKLNNQSWDIKSAGKTNNMQIWSTNSGWFQLFKFVESAQKTESKTRDIKKEKEEKEESYFGTFINWTDQRALDVTSSKDEEGAAVGVNKQNGKDNQKW
jgi:hypothetical protein